MNARPCPSGKQVTLIVVPRHGGAGRADRLVRRRPWSVRAIVRRRLGGAAGGDRACRRGGRRRRRLVAAVSARRAALGLALHAVCVSCARAPMRSCRWRRSAAISSARAVLRSRGVRGTVAAASVIVDVLMQAASQLVFAHRRPGAADRHRRQRADGLAGCRRRRAGAAGARRFSAGAGRRRPAAGQRLLALVAGDRDWLMFGAIDDLFARLDAFYANRRGLIQSVDLASWRAGSSARSKSGSCSTSWAIPSTTAMR